MQATTRHGGKNRIALATLLVFLMTACVPFSNIAPQRTDAQFAQMRAAGQVIALVRFAVEVTGTVHRSPDGLLPLPGMVLTDLNRLSEGAHFPGYARRNASYMGGAPSLELGREGWREAVLLPGRHILTIATLSDGDASGPGVSLLRFAITIPAGTGAAYIGTFRLTCTGARGVLASAARGCKVRPEVVDEGVAAERVLAAHYAGVTPRVTALARPHPGQIADLGIPPPTRPRVSAEGADWATTVDWDHFARSPEMQSGGSSGGMGDLILLPAVIAIETGQAIAAARARAAWEPCANRLTAALAPESLVARLEEEPAGSDPAGWRLRLTRLSLQRCGPAEHYGMAVGLRWTAPGRDAAGDFDAVHGRSVDDRGGRSPVSRIMPGFRSEEVELTPSAPCRHFAQFCGDDGIALAIRDVQDAVAASRALVTGSR